MDNVPPFPILSRFSAEGGFPINGCKLECSPSTKLGHLLPFLQGICLAEAQLCSAFHSSELQRRWEQQEHEELPHKGDAHDQVSQEQHVKSCRCGNKATLIPFCQHTATARLEPGDTQLPRTAHVPFHRDTKGQRGLLGSQEFCYFC